MNEGKRFTARNCYFLLIASPHPVRRFSGAVEQPAIPKTVRCTAMMNSRNLFLVIDLLAWESIYLIFHTTASIPENLIEKGTVDPHFSVAVAVVTDKASFPESVHEKTDLALVVPPWFKVDISRVGLKGFSTLRGNKRVYTLFRVRSVKGI